MKKLTSVLVFALGLFTLANSASALEVGDTVAADIALIHVQTNGAESTHSVMMSTPGPVLLDFFSITCGYCIRSLPKLTAFTNDVATHAAVRVVGIDRNAQRMREFHSVNRQLFNMEFALDNNRDVMRVFGVTATPTYFLVDANGKILFKNEGELEPAHFQQIRALLGLN